MTTLLDVAVTRWIGKVLEIRLKVLESERLDEHKEDFKQRRKFSERLPADIELDN